MEFLGTELLLGIKGSFVFAILDCSLLPLKLKKYTQISGSKILFRPKMSLS